jgi:hypothetical protein
MGSISIHAAISIWSSTVRHENGNLVEGLWRVGPEIPCCLGTLNTGLRMSLLRVDEIRELNWVSDKEHWSIVSDDIIVSFFSIEFHGKTSWISLTIICAALSGDGGEA